MNKIKIKEESFDLNGELITKQSKLEFKALNRKGEEKNISDYKGLTIISAFPDINTSICDAQTQEIAKLALKHKDINFVSITTDDTDVINDWCAAKDIDNVDILSDKKYGEFGLATNSLITKISKLTRGFIILKDGVIEEISYHEEVASDPDYSILNKYL